MQFTKPTNDIRIVTQNDRWPVSVLRQCYVKQRWPSKFISWSSWSSAHQWGFTIFHEQFSDHRWVSGQTAVTQTPQQRSCQSNADTACDIWGRHWQMVNKALIRPVMLHDKSSEYDAGRFCFLKGSYHEESNLPWSVEIKELSALWKHAVTSWTFKHSFPVSGKKHQLPETYKYIWTHAQMTSHFYMLI